MFDDYSYIDCERDSNGDYFDLWLVVQRTINESTETYLEKIDYPLSIRSSSMLEDAQFRPYAGLYSTFMLVNSDPVEAEVYFNGVYRGVTPIEIPNLKSGNARLKLQKQYYIS